jgi:GNAT superfamily N-acetyltransferase
VRIRAGIAEDRPFLEVMLREATFSSDPSISVADVMARPDLAITIPDFSRRGDLARIAEEDRTPLGAAWCRCFTRAEHSWGFLDETTPEVGVAVDAAYRGKGIGGALLNSLIEAARADGWASLSLCTHQGGAEERLYARIGFVKVGALAGTPDSILMRLSLTPGSGS